MIDLGIFDILLNILDTEEEIELKKFVCFAISNCLACNSNIIGKVINHNIFEHSVWRSPSQDYQV